MRLLQFVYRLLAAGLFGAQLFFVVVSTQVVFPPQVAALPHEASLRTQAADLVGGMLLRLDAATIVGAGLLVLCALVGARLAGGGFRRTALPPLLAGMLALASALGTTPAIRAMRAAGQTSDPTFGRLHGLSVLLLGLEALLLLLATWRAHEVGASAHGRLRE